MAGSSSVRNIRRLMEAGGALRIFGLCGLAGVLVDLDHVISLLAWRYIDPKVSEGRIWHTPLLILSCIAICYLGAHIRGLYPKLVLIGVLVVTGLVLRFSSLVVWRIMG